MYIHSHAEKALEMTSSGTVIWRVLSYVNDFNAFKDLQLHPIHFSLDVP